MHPPRAIADAALTGHHRYDLAVTVSELPGADPADRAAQRAALLRGYRSVRPLSDDHEQHLDTLVALRSLLLAVTFAAEGTSQEDVRGILDQLREWTRGKMPW